MKVAILFEVIQILGAGFVIYYAARRLVRVTRRYRDNRRRRQGQAG